LWNKNRKIYKVARSWQYQRPKKEVKFLKLDFFGYSVNLHFVALSIELASYGINRHFDRSGEIFVTYSLKISPFRCAPVEMTTKCMLCNL